MKPKRRTSKPIGRLGPRPGARGEGRHQRVSGRSRRRTRAMIRSRRQQEKDPAAGGRLGQMELLEADLVEVEGGGVGAGARAAAGHDVDDVEQLDRIQEAEGQREQDQRPQLRQGDVAEGLQARSTVELGRLEHLGRDRGQARQQDHEHEGRPLPGIGGDDRDEVPGRLGQPADLDRPAEQEAQEIVGRAERRLQDQRPELADDHRADEQRHDQDRHDQAAAAEALEHGERQQQAERELDRDAGNRKHHRVDQRGAGDRIVHDLAEVL